MNAIDRHVGARLRERRFQAGLNLAELASRIGISPPRLLSFEDGEERVPAQILLGFCRALDMTPMDIFSLEPPRPERRGEGDGGDLIALSPFKANDDARASENTPEPPSRSPAQRG
jgi:transcriptional regulator with XRE-family HTH domain